MGLGTLLLNTDQVATRLRGNGAAPTVGPEPVMAATRDVPAPLPGEPAAEQAEARTVILWPAFGCPQLVDPVTRQFEIICLSKENVNNITIDRVRPLLRDMTVIEWDKAREPYIADNKPWSPSGQSLETLVASDSITILDAKSLDTYKTEVAKSPVRFGSLYHTVAEIVPKAYLTKGFTSILSVRMKLNSDTLTAGKMYALYYAPENGLLRQILQDETLLQKPYDGIPLMSDEGNASQTRIGGPDQVFRGRSGTLNRDHLVRLLHPFMIVRPKQDAGGKPASRDYLNVAHITDLHTSTLWDYFDTKIFPNYKPNDQNLSGGQNRTAAQTLEEIAKRYNNPNLNMRNLTQLVNTRSDNSFIDLILQTGDLIDFNRGFNHKDTHDPDKDYLFNLNWIRFYELLLLDYQRPTFTMLGNHDWRLNPYPPRIKVEPVHVFLFLYLILTLTGCFVSVGAPFGALEKAQGSSSGEKIGLGLIEFLLVPLLFPLTLYLFILLLATAGLGFNFKDTLAILFSRFGANYLIPIAYFIGFVFILVFFVINDSNEKSAPIKDAGDGAAWGAIIGGGLGTVGVIIYMIYLATKGWIAKDYMTHITNLGKTDFDKLLKANVGYLNLFGKDGIFHMTPSAYDWYALVINPFEDYAFKYGNMSFMLANWWGGEVLTGDPPEAADSVTDREWNLLKNHWIDDMVVNRRKEISFAGFTPSQKQVIPIVGLHTPVFCPMLDVNLDELHTSPKDTGDSNLVRGTLDRFRKDLIELFYKLGQGSYQDGVASISAISLTGHTHCYDIFRHSAPDKVAWFEASNLSTQREPGFWDKGLHITTSCAGPPADASDRKKEDDPDTFKKLIGASDAVQENVSNGSGDIGAYYKRGDRIQRPAGCRVLTFDPDTGSLKSAEEISAPLAKAGDS